MLADQFATFFPPRIYRKGLELRFSEFECPIARYLARSVEIWSFWDLFVPEIGLRGAGLPIIGCSEILMTRLLQITKKLINRKLITHQPISESLPSSFLSLFVQSGFHSRQSGSSAFGWIYRFAFGVHSRVFGRWVGFCCKAFLESDGSRQLTMNHHGVMPSRMLE